jgi:HSP20 family protein
LLQHEEEGRTFHRVERRSGSFSRSITLPCVVAEDKVKAEYKDGVLIVSLPKTEESIGRRIKVKRLKDAGVSE